MTKETILPNFEDAALRLHKFIEVSSEFPQDEDEALAMLYGAGKCLWRVITAISMDDDGYGNPSTINQTPDGLLIRTAIATVGDKQMVFLNLADRNYQTVSRAIIPVSPNCRSEDIVFLDTDGSYKSIDGPSYKYIETVQKLVQILLQSNQL